jgi:oligopeptide transport system substrate-binding protein
MRRSTPRLLVAGAMATSLLLAACGGDDEPSDDQTDAAGGGSFSFAITEPSQFAPPASCYESECSSVMRLVYPSLVEVDGESGETTPMAATSVESDDATTWTISLQEGWTFHNGEDVNADAYIRAWNYYAYGPNATDTGFWWDDVVGYDDLQAAEEGEEPAATELAGVTKVDDYTIQVELNGPFSQFPLTMAYAPAVAPMAQECIDDIEACNEQPIGFGPYQFAGPWEHDEQIVLEKYEDYQGPNVGSADEIVFQIYADQSTALRDYQAGSLDIMQPLSEELPTAEEAAGDRLLRGPSSTFTYLGLPVYVPGLDDPDIRRALSMAIDRQTIIDNIFNGVGTPADDVITPVIPGYEEGACEACAFDPEGAKELYDSTDGIPGDKVTIYFNSGSGHERWTEAVGNMWLNNLGVEFELEPLEWADYLEKLELGPADPEGAADNPDTVKGPFRLGWIMDYPSPENYLRPLYSSQGSSYHTWRSEEFDAAVSTADQNADEAGALADYRAAADIVASELPVIPMFFGESIRIWSERVDNLNYDLARSEVRLEEVQVVE